MKFTFTVEVEVERTQGKFASRDEISEAIVEMLEGANEGEVSGVGADGDSVQTVLCASVSQWLKKCATYL